MTPVSHSPHPPWQYSSTSRSPQPAWALPNLPPPAWSHSTLPPLSPRRPHCRPRPANPGERRTSPPPVVVGVDRIRCDNMHRNVYIVHHRNVWTGARKQGTQTHTHTWLISEGLIGAKSIRTATSLGPKSLTSSSSSSLFAPVQHARPCSRAWSDDYAFAIRQPTRGYHIMRLASDSEIWGRQRGFMIMGCGHGLSSWTCTILETSPALQHGSRGVNPGEQASTCVAPYSVAREATNCGCEGRCIPHYFIYYHSPTLRCTIQQRPTESNRSITRNVGPATT